jgi:hypothetical protein
MRWRLRRSVAGALACTALASCQMLAGLGSGAPFGQLLARASARCDVLFTRLESSRRRAASEAKPKRWRLLLMRCTCKS